MSERPPVDKTIAQCRLSGARGGRVAEIGRDRARRAKIPVTLPVVDLPGLNPSSGASRHLLPQGEKGA